MVAGQSGRVVEGNKETDLEWWWEKSRKDSPPKMAAAGTGSKSRFRSQAVVILAESGTSWRIVGGYVLRKSKICAATTQVESPDRKWSRWLTETRLVILGLEVAELGVVGRVNLNATVEELDIVAVQCRRPTGWAGRAGGLS